MIIDMHTHCFPDPLAEKPCPCLPCAQATPARLRRHGFGAERERALGRRGQGCGAQHSHQCPSAEKGQRLCNLLLGDSVLIPFGSVHFESPDAISELDRLHDAGIKGIKLHPDYQGFFADDERMFPIYEKIGSLGMITVFHAGIDIGVPDPVHCTPQMLKRYSPLRRRASHSRAHGRLSALARGCRAARGNGNIYRHRFFLRLSTAALG